MEIENNNNNNNLSSPSRSPSNNYSPSTSSSPLSSELVLNEINQLKSTINEKSIIIGGMEETISKNEMEMDFKLKYQFDLSVNVATNYVNQLFLKYSGAIRSIRGDVNKMKKEC